MATCCFDYEHEWAPVTTENIESIKKFWMTQYKFIDFLVRTFFLYIGFLIQVKASIKQQWFCLEMWSAGDWNNPRLLDE